MRNEKSQNNIGSQEREGSTRLSEAAKFMVDSLFRARIEGSHNLQDIPPDAKKIFVTTHLSDFDVPIVVAKLGDYVRDLTVADASTHEHFFDSPAGYTGRKIAGEKNFFSIDFTGGRGEGHGKFNTDNFEPVKASLETGKPIVIAGYFDTDYEGHSWKLPSKGGYGAVYLNQITENSVIIPVAVDIKSEESFGMGSLDILTVLKKTRPDAIAIIGRPLILPKIEGFTKFKAILDKRKSGIRISPEERNEFSRIRNELAENSKNVLGELAKLLPEEKRGNWNL